MKKSLTFLFAFFICCLLSQSASGATIFSTASGGDWADTLTWVGFTIPGAGDDVVINGPVFAYGATARNVSINSTGSLHNRSSFHYTLTITGDLHNSGTISNAGGYNLGIILGGNLIQNGIFNNRYLTFNGSSDQTITMAAGKTLSATTTNTSKTGGSLIATSDLVFTGANIDLDSDSLILMPGSDVSLTLGYLYDGTVIANNNKIESTPSFYFESVIIENAELGGEFHARSNVILKGNTINTDTLGNASNFNYGINIDGNIINNGAILNFGGYNCELYVTGNITNNGTWDNHLLNLTGDAAQVIQQATDKDFSPYYFNSNKPSGMINSGSSIGFYDTRINLQGDTLHLLSGHDLNLNGGYLNQGEVMANSNEVFSEGGTYFDYITMNKVKLTGTTLLRNSIVFNDSTWVLDTLQNSPNFNYTATFNGPFKNEGVIRNSGGYSFTMNMYNSLYNDGIWQNYIVNLYGTDDQEVEQATGKFFELYAFVDQDTSSVTVATTPLTFVGTIINLNYGELSLNANCDLSISGQYLEKGILDGNGNKLHLQDDAYLGNMEIRNAELTGRVKLYVNNTFKNQVIITDTLENRSTFNYPATIDGDIINNGTIQNLGGYVLSLYINGDITNSGVWKCQNTYLNGANDQYVTENAGSNFGGYRFENLDTMGRIIPVYDISFDGAYLDLNQSTIQLDSGSNMYVNNSYVLEGVIEANGNELNFSGTSYLGYISISDPVFKGTTNIYNNVTTYGEVINEDTLQNRSSYHYTLNNQGNFTNNGVTRNRGGYAFSMQITGDIHNNGLWDHYSTELTGSLDQYITQSPGKVFNNPYFSSIGSASNVYAASDLKFMNTNIDLNNDSLYLVGGNSSLDLDGGYLRETSVFANNNSLRGSNGNYFEAVSIYDPVFEGIIQTRNNCYYYGNLVINGEFANQPNYHYTANIDGNVTNNGWIRNSLNGYAFTMELTGDLIQNGTIDNYRINLVGTSADQTISLVNNKGITATVRMYGNITGSSPYWTREGWAIPGSNSSIYSLSSLGKSDYGIYQHHTSDTTSRLIIVEPNVACTGKDGYENNNTQALSAPLFGGAIAGFGNMILCPRGDVDWFWFEVNDFGKNLEVILSDLPRNYELEVYTAGGLLAQSLTSGTEDELVTIPNVAPGTYYIKVFGWRDAWSPETYNLTAKLVNPSPLGGVAIKPDITSPLFKKIYPQPMISLYPNPAVREVRLVVTLDQEFNGNSFVRIVDGTGKTVYRKETQLIKGNNQINLSIEGLSSGMYHVFLEMDGNQYHQKLSIVR